MADPTLLDVIQQRFGVAIDPDSDGGQILNSLTPHPPFDGHTLTGTADVAPPLSFVLTSSGVSVRRYKPQEVDMLVFSLPSGSIDFTLVPPDAAHAFPQVELKLLSLTVLIPFLRAAKVTPDGTLQEADGTVELRFPDLLLVVNASANPPASAHLAPSHDAAGALEVKMVPPQALFGNGTVVGLGFERAILKLDGPGEPEISAPDVEIYVAPPGIKALAMHGGGHDLHLGLGVSGGLSGDFQVALASGEAAAARPRFLHNLAAHLRLNHNSVTLLELTGQVDVLGEVSARVGLLDDPGGQIDYVLSLALDNGWQASLTLSMSGGRTYLWRTQSNDPETRHPPLDTLGAYAVFTPLLLPTLPGAGSSGYVDLTLGAGVAAGLATSGAVHTVSVTLYGGELVVRQPGGGEPEAFLFFDLETELHFKVKIGDTPLLATRRPLKVRHKAIGLRLDFGPNGGSPQLKPVFDPARGFSLDLSDPGMFEVPAPLGDIVQPEGARMARENPLHFEIDLILKADLGVVTIDRASVRIPVDPAGPPTLTALGAHLNVGMMSGGGYLQFLSDGGLSGGLDFSLAPPLGIRGSGALRLDKAHDNATNEDLTAVLAGLDVEWPIPIPLVNSGLGMFGILGMFAMHMEPNRSPSQDALDWFVNTAHGNAAKSTAWQGVAHQWGFGAGMVIGTVEGGFLIHAKGMLILELPGPRILMVMNADILSPRPAKEGTDTGTFLAVIDIEPGSLTLGIVLDYHPLQPLLEVRVPAEAFFDFTQPENWRLDIGGLPPKLPASVKFLFSFRADGYLLIHGNGIPEAKDPPLSKEDFPLVPLRGFSVAAGIQAALTWGPEDIGLYLKIAAKAAVGISFKPFMVVGHIAMSGELHLFVVSVGASTSADLIITPATHTFYIHAEVCGEVDFFLFSVQGCVTMELGDKPSPPAPEPLFRALSLHSRTPALLPDSGSDRPVDGSLGNAFHFDSHSGQWVGDRSGAILPVVPIDAIPVLQCEMRPYVDPGCQFFGQPIASMLANNDWVRRGQRFYRYTLNSVTLSGTRSDGGPLDRQIGDGETPYVWWDRDGATPKNNDNDVQLALLSWLPDPTPAAAERTVTLDERVKERWGTICVGIAGPAAVLWTFRQSRLGPSTSGWTLTGTPWPDPPGTTRSAPPDPILRVSEPWRASNPLADTLVQVNPAYVLGSAAVLDRLLIAPHTGKVLTPRMVGDDVFNALFQELHPQPLNALADAVRLDTHGLRHIRVLLFVLEQVWSKGLLEVRSLDAAGNATGFEQVLTPANSRQVLTTNDLPGEWSDPASPWFPAVRDVLNAWHQVYMALLPKPLLVFFEADLPAGTTQVEIGLRGDFTAPMPDWGLLIAEGLTEAEVLRYSFDQTSRQNTIKMVNGALGADASKRALLHKDALYTVSVKYDVAVTDPDETTGQPKAPADPPLTDQVQQFRFQTDAAPPDRLEPWVMATDPAQDEQCFFYGDPLRVVFSTNATRKLFKEYQRELFAVVKAASGNNPQGGNGFDPATISLEQTVVAPKAIAMQVTTPFEGALRDVVANQPCIGPLETTTPHEPVTLTMKLEPLTNYILDLEAHSLEGPPLAEPPLHPLFRCNFSTSRYARMQDLANAMLQSGVEHRWLATIKPLSDLAARNPGSAVLTVRDLEMQEALRQVRWGDLARAGQPRVTVIWQDGAGGAPPQPFALLLETPEPLWRERQIPEIVTEPVGDPNAVRRYKLVPRPWLDLVETTAGAAQVARFVHSTDGGRTLAVLQPTARGATLNLALRRTHHPLFEGDALLETAPVVAASLMKAPWEDQL